MKLWMKIFAFTLFLFIVISYFSIFLISRLSYENSLSTARSQAFSQHELISADVSESLKAIIERNDTQNFHKALNSLMNYYLGYYENKDIYLSLEKEGVVLFGNIPTQEQQEALKDVSGARKSTVLTIDNRKYIFASGSIVDEYVLVYAQDITDLVSSQNQLTKQLLLIEIFAVLLFCILLFFIIKQLTKPIIKLQKVSKRITAGELAVRATISGRDEISDLAESFNEMADEIVARIKENEKAARQKQQFIDNLAHELKTPLTAIKGYAELLQNTKTTEEERLNSTFHILCNVDRIQSMSQKLLEMALNRDLKIEFRPVSVSELFMNVKDEFLSVLREKNITLTTSCNSEIIYGDAVLLQNLLCNLIDNSIKASENGGNIALNAYEKDGSIEIEIIDKGVGIAKEDLENVFEPFYRTDFSRANHDKINAGLGLALCKQIADYHHASIEIQSEIGEGTAVKIIFKLA